MGFIEHSSACGMEVNVGREYLIIKRATVSLDAEDKCYVKAALLSFVGHRSRSIYKVSSCWKYRQLILG